MRLTDRLLDGTKKQLEKSKEKKRRIDDDDMDYITYKSIGNLNEYKGVFANDDDTSINTAKSVFDRTAVFHVRDDYNG